MTLVAASMFASSTFAWFSLNTQVQATGMQITATSENKFLQIVNSATSFSSTEAQTSATATNATKAVKPTTAVKSIESGSVTALDNATVASEIKWAEAYSNNPAVSTQTSGYTDVTVKAKASDGTNVYTLINDFKVRLNPDTGVKSANNLRVKSVSITAAEGENANKLLPAVRVLFVCGDNWAIWSTTEESCKETGSVLAAAVKDTPETGIKVYIYFDGNNDVTTTNNATLVSTNGYSIEFTLGID